MSMKSILAPRTASACASLLFCYCAQSQASPALWLDAARTSMPPWLLATGLLLIAGLALLAGLGRRRERNLCRQLRLTASVFRNSSEGIAVTSAEGRILAVNPAFERITGYRCEEVTGKSPGLLSSGRHDARFYREMWAHLRACGHWQGEFWNRRKDGALYAALSNISAVHDEHGRLSHYINLFTDITQLKHHQQRIDQLAHFDALTGLPNRTLLADRLQQATALAQRSGRGLAVCLLDLDVFKPINDRFGHDIGDELLVCVAQRLQQCLNAGDTLARIGGDEFALLLGDIEDVADCDQRVLEILRRVGEPLQGSAASISLSASVGVTLFPLDNADSEQLLRHASQAMYRAKETGRNRHQWFDPEHGRRVEQQQARLQRLQQALEDDELRLHYQPKIDLYNGEVIGCEALLRWQHPQQGLLQPAAFLPALEGSELEQRVGAWVLDHALAQLANWHHAGLPLEMSVNVSAEHLLCPRFSENLQAALARHPQVAAQHLELEILETTALSSMERSALVLEQCRALGVRFALDDFGTGYSSLAYFRRLPVDSLKIDQSFVRDMLADPDSLGIVESVVRLAAAFNRRVVAEGVETREHGERLQRMGCRFGQGYGIARPMSAECFAGWLQHWRQDNPWTAQRSLAVSGEFSSTAGGY
ncbi:diguanylate cyclase [Pseudomonas mangrovi]|uniref:Diguanylate cyclase n=2 Tax=Pseudomonas mangrovi TaxID=2161748 RepID=A0A2T5PEH0_9PSED|nr:diguanylate cyclase [Pseudomonas mangrovi]